MSLDVYSTAESSSSLPPKVQGGTFVERRVESVSLLERRLADPGARERRQSARTAQAEGVTPASAGRSKSLWERMRRLAPGETSGVRAAPEAFAPVGSVGVRADRPRGLMVLGAVLLVLQGLVLLAVIRLGRAHAAEMRELGSAVATSREIAQSVRTIEDARMRMESVRPLGGSLQPGALQAVAVDVPARQSAAVAAAAPARLVFSLEKTAEVAAHLPVLFHFSVRNRGGGPASGVRVWSAVKLVEVGEPLEFDYGQPILERDELAADAPPARVIPYTRSAGEVAPLREEEVARVRSGSAYLVAYGRAVWQDGAGGRHWAQFCTRLTQPAEAPAEPNRCAAYTLRGVLPARARRPEAPKRPVATALEELAALAKAEDGEQG